MKLDATDLRYITSDEFRVLTAVEMGSKNHEVVPTVLIVQISGLRNGGVNKIMGSLAKRNLVAKVQNSKYDGYRLTYGGYDYLAMRALSKRDSMYSVGNQIGVGKESDIYIVADAEGNEMVLKLHRLGRISFRAIKEKRDYLGKRKSASWMYMSRLAAQKEWAFMKVLYEHGFPVPRPIDQARHCILMGFQDAYPLRQISEVPSPGKLYSELMDLIVRFARAGLIHGDFNEFNILIHRETGDPIVIDFPQMVSTSHENAEWYFNRDVECIRTFFRRRFRYESALYPRFRSTISDGENELGDGFRLDVVVSASGFGRKEARILEEYMEAVKDDQPEVGEEEEEGEEEEDEDEDDEPVEDEHAVENMQQTERDGPLPNQMGDNIEPNKGDSQDATAPQTNMIDKEKPKAEHRDLSSSHPDVEGLSDSSRPDREISRSPPQSRASSPSSLSKMTAALSLSSRQHLGIKDIVSSDLTKQRARQQQKYHSKRGAHRIGRPKGSKAKQDTRVKLDTSGVWE